MSDKYVHYLAFGDGLIGKGNCTRLFKAMLFIITKSIFIIMKNNRNDSVPNNKGMDN